MAEKKILDPDEFMAKQGAIEDPDAFMAATGAAPSTLAAPPPEAPPSLLGLAGNFLGGHGGKGGLVSDLARGVMGIPHMLTSPFEWSRGVAQQSIDQFKESENKGRPFVGSLMTAIPLIGPAATKTGEQIGTGDPRDIAAGLGSTVAQILPFGGAELATKVASKIPGVAGIGEAAESGLEGSVNKSYAKALNAPTTKLAATANKVAPTLSGVDMRAMSLEDLADQIAERTKTAGKEVDRIVEQKYGKVPIDKDALLTRIDSLKDRLINPNTGLRGPFGLPRTTDAAKAIEVYDELRNDLDRDIGPNPTVSDIRAHRQILDKEITGGKKAFADASNAQRTALKKDVSNILRDTINNVSPEIAEANDAYSQWSGAQRVSQEALQKSKARAVMPPSAQGGILNMFAGRVSKIMDLVGLRNNSAAWNTLSAAAKKSVLESLKAGEVTPAAENAILTANIASQRPKKATYFPSLAESIAPPPPPPVLPPVGVQ